VILTNRLDRLPELLELRKLRKSRQGIDATKLNQGDVKKRRKRPRERDEGLDKGGLRDRAVVADDDDE
jgi:hypothetical protein